MTAQTAIRAQHATIAGGGHDEVTSYTGAETVTVTNRHASSPLYYTVSGLTAVAAADETFVVLAGQSKTLKWPKGASVVSLIGTDVPYSVELD